MRERVGPQGSQGADLGEIQEGPQALVPSVSREMDIDYGVCPFWPGESCKGEIQKRVLLLSGIR